MEELIRKIDRAIEEKQIRTGAMGTESVTVFIRLTKEEEELFYRTENITPKITLGNSEKAN